MNIMPIKPSNVYTIAISSKYGRSNKIEKRSINSIIFAENRLSPNNLSQIVGPLIIITILNIDNTNKNENK